MHKEIPILFSTDMVRAILAGRKTVTRRIVKAGFELKNAKFDCIQIHERDKIGLQAYFSLPDTVLSGVFGTRCPYGQPGDTLWVREKYGYYQNDSNSPLEYRTSVTEDKAGLYKWKPSIHMPKEAARIWLRVKDVRVERLQDITEADAIAEGISFYNSEIDGRRRYKDYMADASGYGDPNVDYPSVGMPICSFSTL